MGLGLSPRSLTVGPISAARRPQASPHCPCRALALSLTRRREAIPCLRRFVRGLPGGEPALPGLTPAALGFHFLASARPPEASAIATCLGTKGSFLKTAVRPRAIR